MEDPLEYLPHELNPGVIPVKPTNKIIGAFEPFKFMWIIDINLIQFL